MNVDNQVTLYHKFSCWKWLDADLKVILGVDNKITSLSGTHGYGQITIYGEFSYWQWLSAVSTKSTSHYKLCWFNNDLLPYFVASAHFNIVNR